VLAAVFLPAVYRSKATILIEQQEIPSDLVRTTVTSFADQRIQIISQRVMTTRNLSTIIERYDLYPDIRRRESINAAVEEMREAVDLQMISADVVDPRSGRPEQATIAFSLAYENEGPTLAQKVTNELVSLYLNENIEQRKAAVEQATTFLAAEGNRLGDQINSLEEQLAAFKEKHGDNLPEFAALNRELMARTEARIRDNAQAVRTLSEQQVYLESELAQLSPTAGAGAPGSSREAHLQELEARYAGIASRYSPDHPDRVQIENEIAALRQQIGQSGIAAIEARLADLNGELAVLRERYSEAHPDVGALKRSISATQSELAKAKRSRSSGARQWSVPGATNPAYMQISAKLDSTRLEIQSLRQAGTDLDQELARLEARITEAPRIEQEYRALTRDYDNAMAKYKEVRDKEMQAQLAEALESDRKSERFSLIEPPLVPEKPDKPNRPAILFLGLVLSIAGGVGNLALREVLDKSLRGERAIFAVTGAPPLASIPIIETRADRRRRAIRIWFWIIGVSAALVGGALAVHFFWRPLDVIWFTLLRRIELLLPVLSSAQN
jgi:uncharacterized protein involved in exopolysaccharide biosynthesis